MLSRCNTYCCVLMAIFQMLTCLSENLPVILKYMYGAYNYVHEKEQQHACLEVMIIFIHLRNGINILKNNNTKRTQI